MDDGLDQLILTMSQSHHTDQGSSKDQNWDHAMILWRGRNPTIQIREVPRAMAVINPFAFLTSSQSHHTDQGSSKSTAAKSPTTWSSWVAIPPYRSGKFQATNGSPQWQNRNAGRNPTIQIREVPRHVVKT